MSERRCLLLINPKARSGADAKGMAEKALADAGFLVDSPVTSSPDDAHASIRASDAELIVIGGGDGTIAEAAPALLAAGKTVGILPLGTANDLAGSLGIPKRLDAAVDVIAQGEPRGIDVGFVNDKPFFNAVTIGLGVDVIRAHDGPMKKRLGIMNYPRVILQTMRDRQYFDVSLRADGEVKRAQLLHLGVANGRYHGGGLPAHADATIDDGILHLYAVQRATPMRYVRTLPALLLGRHSSDLLRLAGKEIIVETAKPLPFSADGEEVGTTPLRLSCKPHAMTVMTPKHGVAGPSEQSPMAPSQV